MKVQEGNSPLQQLNIGKLDAQLEHILGIGDVGKLDEIRLEESGEGKRASLEYHYILQLDSTATDRRYNSKLAMVLQ